MSAASHLMTQRSGLGRGFTLIEVVGALAVVAIALMAGFQASSALSQNAQRQADLLLAHICAENELVKARLSKQMPGVGDSNETCEQGGRSFAVNIKVRPTPNPSFMRMEAQVLSDNQQVLNLSTIIGRY